MDQIHKHVRAYLHSCNTTNTEDMESGGLTESGGLYKKVGRGEWLTSTPEWVDMPVQKEEGRWKYDGRGIGERPSGGGCGRDVVFNHGVDLQLQIMEILGEMTAAAH